MAEAAKKYIYLEYSPRGFLNETIFFRVPSELENAVYDSRLWNCADYVPGTWCEWTTNPAARRKAIEWHERMDYEP